MNKTTPSKHEVQPKPAAKYDQSEAEAAQAEAAIVAEGAYLQEQQTQRNYQILQAAATMMSSGRMDIQQAKAKAIELLFAIQRENP